MTPITYPTGAGRHTVFVCSITTPERERVRFALSAFERPLLVVTEHRISWTGAASCEYVAPFFAHDVSATGESGITEALSMLSGRMRAFAVRARRLAWSALDDRESADWQLCAAEAYRFIDTTLLDALDASRTADASRMATLAAIDPFAEVQGNA